MVRAITKLLAMRDKSVVSNPVPKDVAVLDNYVTLVDADPKIDAALGRKHTVSLRHLRLYLAGTVQRVDGASEFGQEAVARGLDDSAVMGGDARIDQLSANGSQSPKGALFVGANQPRVPGYISGENGGKAAGRWHCCRVVKELLSRLSP